VRQRWAIATVFCRIPASDARRPDKQQRTVHYVAAASILLVALFNFAGVHVGALIQNMTAGTKYAALILLVLASFLLDPASATTGLARADTASSSVSLFGLALIFILWVYDGWADLTLSAVTFARPNVIYLWR
jgi:amino acid transporter